MRAWCGPSRLLLRPQRCSFFSSSIQHRHISVAELLSKNEAIDKVSVHGWVRSLRKQKRIAFAALGDGSTITPLQAVLQNPELATDLSHGTAVKLTGSWVASGGKEQSHELQVTDVQVLGANDAENNPLQPKYQTAEFLRTIPHLRARVPGNALLLRLRSRVVATLTRFFHEADYVQTHPPIITSSDCEGAGEVFTVTTRKDKNATEVIKPDAEGEADHFFRQEKYLTVSNQLHLEALAMAVSKVWTLSPTFRAEKSDTARHLAEFYMLEAEICFTTSLSNVMDLVESLLRTITTDLSTSRLGQELLTHRESLQQQHSTSPTDPAVLSASDLATRWAAMTSPTPWPRMTYVAAITALQQAAHNQPTLFQIAPTAEAGLAAEHERWLAAHAAGGRPLFVTDYPAAQKPFYMPASTNGAETVACFDLLVPDVCELVGGSLREHRASELAAAMAAKGVDVEKLGWYMDLRRYGSVPHGGFGLGFDRLLCYLSGTPSVRDVVAFPRWYGRCDC